MKFLFLAFVVIPIIEIYVLISLGSMIGALTTIALIVLTAVVGAMLVRSQGFSTYHNVQQQLARGEVPAIEIFEAMFLLVAGALLLTPGFVTDAIGFACLTPPLRKWLIRKVISSKSWRSQWAANATVVTTDGAAHRTVCNGEQSRPAGRIIDGEYHDLNS